MTAQLRTYKERLKTLSELIVVAQKPIRILDAIKWLPETDEKILKSKFKDIPKIDKAYYEQYSLGMNPEKKVEEFDQIIAKIKLELGEGDALGQYMVTMCEEYKDVVHMLKARGTKDFYKYSKKLYGSPKETFADDQTTVKELALVMYDILSRINDTMLGHSYPKTLTSEKVVDTLNKRFAEYFTEDHVTSVLSDGIVADAAAGADKVKINHGSFFSERDVQILEVHEGWVHVGTTINGANQHIIKCLSKGTPRTTPTQEGLAVLMEVFTFSTYPRRARKINHRVLGIDKAEDGADFMDLVEFFRTEGHTEEDCLQSAKRIVRGGMMNGGAPFTKDISYIKGFIENYNFIRAAMKAGRPELIPFLFVGKVTVRDVPIFYKKFKEGIIDLPRYLPPQFKDLNGVAVWMSFSNVFNMINMKKVQESFASLFEESR